MPSKVLFGVVGTECKWVTNHDDERENCTETLSMLNDRVGDGLVAVSLHAEAGVVVVYSKVYSKMHALHRKLKHDATMGARCLQIHESTVVETGGVIGGR